MDVRGKLIKLLSDNFADFTNVDIVSGNCKIRAITFNADDFADYLIAAGVTITPAVSGPSEDDHNIMELCFHNGERHMKEKVITMLQDVLDQADGFCMIDVSCVVQAVEEL